MSRKIGLVIQGALMSVGRAGNNLHATPEEVKSGGIVHFDSRENIQRIIDEYGHLFDKIIVSVFDNQLKPEDSWRGAEIVSSPDPGGIPQVGHYKDNNKVRQFLSTLNGIKELEKSGMEYAVKVRTDQYMDIDKMVESFFAEREKHPNKRAIGATVTHPPTFLLHDLYFIAETQVLKGFCEAILAHDHFEFIQSVHRDMVLKHAYAEYRKEIGVPDSAYFPFHPPSGVSAETRKIFDYMFEHVYFDLSQEVFRSTTWRGAHYEKEHVDRLMYHKKAGKRRNIPNWASTDWHRYFSFRKEVYGVEMSLTDRLLAKAGKLGWDLWNLARKAVRMVR